MKKQMFLSLAVWLMLLLNLSSFTSDRRVTDTNPPAEPAKIYIYRGGQLFGAGMNYSIFANDSKICKLSNNKYILYEAQPGKLEISARSGGLNEALIKKTTSIELEVESGKSYYIRCDVKTSITRTRLEMSEVTEGTGKRDMGDMEPDRCKE